MQGETLPTALIGPVSGDQRPKGIIAALQGDQPAQPSQFLQLLGKKRPTESDGPGQDSSSADREKAAQEADREKAKHDTAQLYLQQVERLLLLLEVLLRPSVDQEDAANRRRSAVQLAAADLQSQAADHQ